MMQSAARHLAVAAASSHFAEAVPAVREAYRNFILDTIAVMAAGAAHPSIRDARHALAETGGGSSCLGFAEPCTAGTAGLINGMAMTVLQLQDGHRRARGHPMSHVLPAALAVAEETQASAVAFLNAVMAGYEVCARVGSALGGMQPLLHDTGTFGCIGAAVAAAYLFGQDMDEQARASLIEAAIGNAAAVALFPFRDTCMEGAGAHHLFVGLGVQNGIVAARSAKAGLLPSVATLERFFGPRAGEAFSPSVMVEGIGEDGRWSHSEITSAYLKWHPVCAHLGPMLDCIELLRERVDAFDPARLVEVRIDVYSTALQYDSPSPKSDLAARFSFRHAAALALCFGPLRHDGFGKQRLEHADVLQMVEKITLCADERFDALYPANRPTRVTLFLSDGNVESVEVMVPKGDGERALTRADVDLKAKRLIDSAWGEGHSNLLVTLIDRIEGSALADFVVELGQLLRRPLAT
ncbi:MmgE/PrpD family protein [Agrobacterium vaccinii]|uniref:MmgE/PrpD family protein n=1 Tax=Agrobacterium vaccinii TaxID=2735528 RepID=UPI001E4F8DC3|nr:MmgE/PrpD family protein [Agrobacterium vaccinii]UHS58452.1 MmgE/PrpD family protein [Agrobacterium vaccinii]UHS63164.1 MmgE/PrpD family protein [Agrobacterium vaccinii]